MPTYEYVCENCGEQLEVFQSFHDRPLTKHSACGGRLSKVIHPTGVIFKGLAQGSRRDEGFEELGERQK